MSNFLKTLGDKLNIEQSALYEALGIKEGASFSQICNALNIYSIFETKEAQEEYITNKLANKQKEINSLNEELKNIKNNYNEISDSYKKVQTENEKGNSILNNYVKAKWESLGIARPYEKSGLDLGAVNFEKLEQDLLSFATSEGYAINTKNEQPKSQHEDITKNISGYAFNGVVANVKQNN